MAVEIPVIIDIEGAFADAAKRVDKASAPLRSSIEQLNKELSEDMEIMKMSQVNSDLFKDAAKDVQRITQYMELANDQFLKYSSNSGSLRRMNAELASLERRWQEMGSAQKFTAGGELSGEAKQLKAEYIAITEQIKRSGKSISQMIAEEQKLLALKKKGAQSRQYENAILNTTVKTMRVLQEQERILSSRLQTTPVGSKKFQDLSAKLVEVRKEMAQAEAQARRGGAAFRDLGSGAARATTQVQGTTAALSTQGGVLKRLSGYLSGYALLFTGLRFIHNIRETTAELEMQEVALGKIIQDTDKASELFRQIKAAALKSPFEIKDLVTYTKQLAAYRIETENLFSVTMRLADISAGLGVDMNRLILAYGQVRAAAVLRGQELRQFTEAGIPLVEKLAEKFRQLGREGTTTADVFELISKRAVPFSMIESIFNDMTSAGGEFYKMQERQSETLKGQWMKLKDSITIMYNEMGNTKPVREAMESFIKTANSLTRSWREVGNWIKTIIGMFLAYNVAAKASVLATNSITRAEAMRLAVTKAQTIAIPKAIAAMLSDTAAKKVSIWVTRRLEIAQYKLATATTLTERAFWKLYAAIIANPYAAAAAAAVGLALGIYTLIKNNKEAAITTDELNQSIETFKNSAEKAGDVTKLINAYEQLANKAEKTADEQDRLKRITDELSRVFPSAVSGITAENGALEVNIEKIKELAIAERDLELARLKRDKRRTKNTIKSLEEERDSILRKYKMGGYTSYEFGGPTYGQTKFVPWSEDELADFGVRLREINAELVPMKESLEEIDKLFVIGPMPAKGDDTTKTLRGWRKILSDIQSKKVAAGAQPMWSKDDIEKMEDIHALWKQVKKEMGEAEIELASLKALQSTLVDEDAIADNKAAIALAEKRIDLFQTIKETFGFIFKKENSSYTQDPFIKQMENRMKFMKDFQKGYEDLSKYLAHDTALEKELGYMRERGLSLGLDENEQKRAARDLSKWYQDTLNSTFEYLKKEKGVSGEMSDFLSKQITGSTNRDKMLRDFQSMMQSLFDAKTDFDVSQQKKNIEDALKRLSEQVKQSEQAKNFYEDILGLTGDKDLATSLSLEIYGSIGDDFKKRIQDELKGTFEAISPDEAGKVSDVLKKAIESGDINALMAHINELPEKLAEAVRKAADATEKYNADIAKSYAKLLFKFDEIEQQRVNITKQAAKDIADIEAGLQLELEAMRKKGATADEQQAAKDRASLAKGAVERQSALDLSKLEKNYRLFFSSVGVISTKAARSVAAAQKKMITDQFARGEISLSKYKREINEIDAQLEKYTMNKGLIATYLSEGLDGVISKVKEYADGLRALASTITVGEGGVWTPTEDEKKFVDEMNNVLNLGAFARIFQNKDIIARIDVSINKAAQDAYNKAIQSGKSNAVAMEKASAAASEAAASAGNEMAAAAGDFAGGLAQFELIFNSIGGWIKLIEKDASWGGGRALDWGYSLFGFNDEIMNAWNAIKSGDFFGAMWDIGLAVREITKPTKLYSLQIKDQAELIDDLKHEYERLDVAIQKAFGSDYIANYNQQISVLQAQADAYRKQAELERKKEKKADEDTAKGYEKSARDVEDQIADMQSQLSEFFTGSDLTSAAKDFAEAWIEAYKQFGNTTDAMKEKFSEMIENMVVNSLAAQLIQGILKPVFDQIDLASKDGELTAQEIGAISAMLPERMRMIDDSMLTMMNQLTSAGINLREQAGQFTGISRDIAGASEESITGLAAGINTQNFYISHIDANVAAILATLTGGASTAGASVTGEYVDPYKDQMLAYAAYIPMVHDEVATIHTLLSRVIQPRTAKPDYVLHTNL